MLTTIRSIIQQDVGNRGLASDPADNLLTACPHDLEAACKSIANTPRPRVAVVTGFFIPSGQPPCGETDGPLGALFLARAWVPMGVEVTIVTDAFCMEAISGGLSAVGLDEKVGFGLLPDATWAMAMSRERFRQSYVNRFKELTHLVALERAGPAHNLDSIAQQGEDVEVFRQTVSNEHFNRCHTMRGRDITAHMSPAHLLFEDRASWLPKLTTIGIGDGGNEIGMGKIRWSTIARNIPGGAKVACRVPTDHLIVCGISNWGAYGLAAGVCALRGQAPNKDLFSLDKERELLKVMVESGPLVDGVLGKPSISVDGLDFDRYAEPLTQISKLF